MAELPVPTGEPLARELEAFVRVVREGERPEVDAEDGGWAVAIATRSSRRRRAAGPWSSTSYPRGSRVA